MGINEYKNSLKLEVAAYSCDSNSFYTLLMAAMRCADSDNQERLRKNWPSVWYELNARYNAPGGVLESDT